VIRSLVDVPIYQTFDEAHNAAMIQEIPFKSSPGELGAESNKNWIKLDSEQYRSHYQFKGGSLSMISLSSKDI